MTANRFLIAAVFLAAGFAGGVTTSVAIAERGDPLIYVVDFMQVDPADKGTYERLERETWKAVHAERIERGLMRGWGLYEVRYPLGTAKPYDYATVNAFAEYGDLDMSGFDFQALFESAHPGQDPAEVAAGIQAGDVADGRCIERLVPPAHDGG